jgi:TPR repeat protein
MKLCRLLPWMLLAGGLLGPVAIRAQSPQPAPSKTVVSGGPIIPAQIQLEHSALAILVRAEASDHAAQNALGIYFARGKKASFAGDAMESLLVTFSTNTSQSLLAIERAYQAELSAARRQLAVDLAVIQTRQNARLEVESLRFGEYARELREVPDEELIRRFGADTTDSLVRTSLAQAKAAEQNHRWLESGRRYVDVLRFIADHADARDGLARSQAALVAEINFDEGVNRTAALIRSGQFDLAANELGRALVAKPDHVAIDDRTRGLQATLVQMNRRQSVSFRSDGQTWYSVFGGLKGGALNQQSPSTLQLFPGEYVVRGYRPGYDSVEVRFRVEPGQPTPPIYVAAKDNLERKYAANDETAATWFRRSAEAGFPAAQYNLGLMYRAGRGVKADSAQAFVWWSLALAGGSAEAKSPLAELTKRLSAKELSRAQTLLEEQRKHLNAPDPRASERN